MSQENKSIPFAEAKEVYDSSFRVARTTISVVDAMCQRGAVKGEELSAIGQLRDQCVQLAQLCEAFQSANEE
jgi:predicted methyltransferase